MIKTLIGVIALVAILGGLIFIVYRGRVAEHRDEYEGTIVEKWAGYTHSEEGSFPYYRLLVESNGQKFTVLVDSETYQRAQTGGRIRKSKSGIELETSKNPGPH